MKLADLSRVPNSFGSVAARSSSLDIVVPGEVPQDGCDPGLPGATGGDLQRRLHTPIQEVENRFVDDEGGTVAVWTSFLVMDAAYIRRVSTVTHLIVLGTDGISRKRRLELTLAEVVVLLDCQHDGALSGFIMFTSAEPGGAVTQPERDRR